MVQRCGNCHFARQVDGLSPSKRVCTNNAARPDRWFFVGADDHCGNYYVSHAAMIRENGDDEKYKGARVIGISKGMYTLVDESDYAQLSRYKWYMMKGGRNRYAFRAAGKKQIKMHRQITRAPAGLVVDHIDNDGLNNRRSNLRLCTIKQNSRNARGRKGTSEYKGVCWCKLCEKWQASIACDGRGKTIGFFEHEIDAALAYDEYARELFGEYAYLNFPVGFFDPSSGFAKGYDATGHSSFDATGQEHRTRLES